MSKEPKPETTGKIVVFGAKQIRRVWVDEQWYFSVVDIIAALTENPRDYWYRMKQREQEASGIELSTLCRQLKLTSSDGKAYTTETASTRALQPNRVVHFLCTTEATLRSARLPDRFRQ